MKIHDKSYLDKYIKIIVAVYVVFQKEDQVLLLKRENTGYFDGFYSLPAGHLDGDEAARNAAAREVKEEVGINISVNDLEFIHALHRRSTIPAMHERVDFFFRIKSWQGEPINAEPHKHSEVKWYPAMKLPENMVPEVRFALDRISKGEIFSEFGFR